MTIRAPFRGTYTLEELRAFLATDQQPVIVAGEMVGCADNEDGALSLAKRADPKITRVRGEIVEIEHAGEIISTAGFIPWE